MGKISALGFVLAVFGTTSQAVATDSAESAQLEEIIVTAALRPSPTPCCRERHGTTETTLRDAGQQHWRTFSLGAQSQLGRRHSRPRYFRFAASAVAAIPGRAQPSSGFSSTTSTLAA
jgi:hypothetical protein